MEVDEEKLEPNSFREQFEAMVMEKFEELDRRRQVEDEDMREVETREKCTCVPREVNSEKAYLSSSFVSSQLQLGLSDPPLHSLLPATQHNHHLQSRTRDRINPFPTLPLLQFRNLSSIRPRRKVRSNALPLLLPAPDLLLVTVPSLSMIFRSLLPASTPIPLPLPRKFNLNPNQLLPSNSSDSTFLSHV